MTISLTPTASFRLDGRRALACITLAMSCQGKKILTIEGLAERNGGTLHPLQKAFVEKSGMQCGVCTSGMILTAKAFLDEGIVPESSIGILLAADAAAKAAAARRIPGMSSSVTEGMRTSRSSQVRTYSVSFIRPSGRVRSEPG